MQIKLSRSDAFMKEKIVCVLCNNLYFFKLMLVNMPKQSEEIGFVIFNDERVVDLKEDIKAFLKEYKDKTGCNNRFKVVSAKEVNEYLLSSLEGLTKSGKQYLQEYTMGLNINVQYYIMSKYKEVKKFVYLDDDILINGDLEEVFKEEDFLYVGNNFCSGKEWTEKDSFAQEVLYLADVSLERWKTHNINSGCRLFICRDGYLKVYEDLLVMFYNNREFRRYFALYKATGKYRTRSFFQDQYFENCFLWRINRQNSNMHKYCRLVYSFVNKRGEYAGLKDKRLYNNKLFTHYALSKKNKMEFLKSLIEEGIIKESL